MTPEQAAQAREERRRAIEPGRLTRALALKCDRTGPGQYAVLGSTGKVYDVDLNGDIPCYCADVQYRDVRCKHQILAALHEHDPKVMQAVQVLAERVIELQKEYDKYRRSLQRQSQGARRG